MNATALEKILPLSLSGLIRMNILPLKDIIKNRW